MNLTAGNDLPYFHDLHGRPLPPPALRRPAGPCGGCLNKSNGKEFFPCYPGFLPTYQPLSFPFSYLLLSFSLFAIWFASESRESTPAVAPAQDAPCVTAATNLIPLKNKDVDHGKPWVLTHNEVHKILQVKWCENAHIRCQKQVKQSCFWRRFFLPCGKPI